MKQKKMNFYDKIRFITYQFKSIFSIDLLMVPVMFFVLELIYFIIEHDTVFDRLGIVTLIVLIPFLIFIVFSIFSINNLRVLLSKNVYIIDGYIFKMHLFNKKNSEYSVQVSKARAISEDRNITTDWIDYPKEYFNYKNQKVKIIIHKNRAIDFYIDD